jgi:hypothetical protein
MSTMSSLIIFAMILLSLVCPSECFRLTHLHHSHPIAAIKHNLPSSTALSIFKKPVPVPEPEAPLAVEVAETDNPLKYAYFSVWLALVVYVFGNIAPADVDPDFSATMIQKILTTPYDGTVNPIFVAIFNLLGVYPALFASLLLPASKKQPIVAWPFIFGAFALGYFAEGPYLAFRKIRTSGSIEEVGAGNRLFDNKIAPILLFGFSAFLTYFAIFGDFLNGDRIEDFIRLFMSQRLVHVSTIDFTILTFVVSS